MHAPLAKFSMMRRLMSSAWWLSNSAIDIDFQNNRAHDGIPLDPLRASTVLMLHGDGADASTNISDSTGRHFVTPSGSGQVDTAQSKFGGSSLNTTVAGVGCFTITDGMSDFNFGTSDFTVDCWVRVTTVTGIYQYLFETTSAGVYQELVIYAGGVVFYRVSAIPQIVGSTVLSLNTWHHVALVRSGGSTKLFLNGVQEGSTYSDSNNYQATSFVVSADVGSHTQPVEGWVDEFRVVKGVAAWTTTFTPPTMPYNVGVGPYDLLSCSRASTGYAQTVAGTLTQFAANQLRITDLGLLVEDTRTNSITRSQNFSHADWVNQAAAIVDNSAVAPDGTSTAALMTVTVAGATMHDRYNILSPAIGSGVVTTSCFIKAGTNNFAVLIAVGNSGTDRYGVVINLTTGAITDTHSTGSPSSPSSAVDALGNGWFRVSITKGGGAAYIIVGISDSATPTWDANNQVTFVGSGTETIYVWGGQVELGAFVSSYIPTTTGGLARAADSVTMIGSLVRALNGTPYSMCVDCKYIDTPGAGINERIIGADSSNATHSPLYAANSNTILGSYDGSSITTTLGNSLTFTSGVKVAASLGSGRSLVGGGGTVATDAGGSVLGAVPVLGADGVFGNRSYLYFRRLTGWTERLADATLQALTSPTGPSPTNYAVDLNFQTGVYTVNARPQFYLSCSRASIGYAQTVAGALTQFAVDQLRITDLGLLVEDTRTNLLLYSQEIGRNGSADPWVDSTISHTLNAVAAPDGTTTASRIFENSTSNTFYQCYQGLASVTNGVAYTFSVYAKAGTRSWIKVSGPDDGSNNGVWFDLTNGAIGTLDSGYTASMDTLANGWYRCKVTRTTTSVTDSFFHVFITTANNVLAHVGVVGQDVYVWGAQLELGAFATSYIPTTTGALARAADNVVFTGTLETVIEGSDVSIVDEVKDIGLFVGANYVTNITINPIQYLSNTQMRSYVYGESIDVTIGNSLTFAANVVKMGVCWAASGRSAVAGGGTVGTGFNVPSGETGLGFYNASATHSYVYHRRLTAWNTRLANATLQGFTNP